MPPPQPHYLTSKSADLFLARTDHPEKHMLQFNGPPLLPTQAENSQTHVPVYWGKKHILTLSFCLLLFTETDMYISDLQSPLKTSQPLSKPLK